MRKKIKNLGLLFIFLALFPACSDNKEVKSSGTSTKAKLILINNRSPEGNYYLDKRTEAQVFVPKGMVLDLKSSWPDWGNNFLIRNSENNFKIYIRFDAISAENEEMNECKQALLTGPLPQLNTDQMKVYPFLKGEFNADAIVTTEKALPLPNTAGAKANLFQIRKNALGCYTFLFIYENDASLAAYSTEKEIMEYVRFE